MRALTWVWTILPACPSQSQYPYYAPPPQPLTPPHPVLCRAKTNDCKIIKATFLKAWMRYQRVNEPPLEGLEVLLSYLEVVKATLLGPRRGAAKLSGTLSVGTRRKSCVWFLRAQTRYRKLVKATFLRVQTRCWEVVKAIFVSNKGS